MRYLYANWEAIDSINIMMILVLYKMGYYGHKYCACNVYTACMQELIYGMQNWQAVNDSHCQNLKNDNTSVQNGQLQPQVLFLQFKLH